MSRITRKNINSSYFHIITQGINKQYIFSTPEDSKYYIKTIYKLSTELKINVISYCIMGNHSHILLKVPNNLTLSKFMQRLNTTYAVYYNKKYNRVGYVFRDRYKSEGIFSELQLYNCMKYIYNNPVKSGICKNASDYPYCNYKEIPKKYCEKEYVFLDVDKNDIVICKKIFNKFLINNNMNYEELVNDNFKLNELIKILKEQYNISLRKISEGTKINREFIRTIYHKY